MLNFKVSSEVDKDKLSELKDKVNVNFSKFDMFTFDFRRKKFINTVPLLFIIK